MSKGLDPITRIPTLTELPMVGYARADLPSFLTPGVLARITDEGNLLVISTGTDWTPVTGELDVRWFGASGAKTNTAISTTFTRTSASKAPGQISVDVLSGSSFADGQTIKITGGGPGGGVYRGVITAGGTGTSWLVYPAIYSMIASGASVHHGDNNVTTLTTLSASALATTITVASSSTFAVGQGIYIAGGGSAPGGSFPPHIASITGVAGNEISFTPGLVTAISDNALVMHDETAAFNAAVAVAATLRSATIRIPAGVYMVNGPGTGSSLGRIQLPVASDIANPLTIRFIGEPRTIPTFPAFFANHGITTNGTIIQSDGAGGAIVSGDNGAGGFTLIDGQFFDITFRAYDNPKIRGLDGRLLVFFRAENCMTDTATQAGAVTQPTDTTNFGIATGLTANGGQEVLRNVWSVGGWYSGMDLAEHAVLEGDCTTFGNYYGARLDSAMHPIIIPRLAVHECTRSIGVLSPLRYKIGALVCERRWAASPLPAWLDTEWDIYDPNSYGSGEVGYTTFEGLTGSFATSFLVNGAVDLMHYPLSTGKVTNFGTPFSENFDDNSIDTFWWTIGSQAGVDGSTHGTVVEQNSRLEIAPQASVAGIRYRGYVTKDTFNLLGKTVTVKVPQVASNGAITTLLLRKDSMNGYQISVSGTSIAFVYVYRGTPTGVVSITYNATNHLWWRIRESAGYVVTAEVSADGSSWSNLGTDTAFRMYFIQMRVSLEAGTESSIATPGEAWFDNFSIT